LPLLWLLALLLLLLLLVCAQVHQASAGSHSSNTTSEAAATHLNATDGGLGMVGELAMLPHSSAQHYKIRCKG
jgi:hypothetical protein